MTSEHLDVTPLSRLAEAALAYADLGWPVFPCRPHGKAPLGRLVRNGVKDASVNPDQIRSWWRQAPQANVAVACGAPGPDVLDVDTKDGRSGQDLYRRAWRGGLLHGSSAMILTPSGGRHFWFAGTDQRGGAVGKDKALELKAQGGYVLLPPSYVVCAEYGYAGHYEVLERSDQEGTVDFAAIRRFLEPPPFTPAPVRHAHRPRLTDGTTSPGDDYNQRADWAEILLPYGWAFVGQRDNIGYWRRPGKPSGEGISATTNGIGTDRFHVFTTSTAFEPTSYSKFGAYALLAHGGDHSEAARALRRLGYGSARPDRVAA